MSDFSLPSSDRKNSATTRSNSSNSNNIHGGLDNSNTNRNANNYVDFNQFILQHNLLNPIRINEMNYYGYYPSEVPYMPVVNSTSMTSAGAGDSAAVNYFGDYNNYGDFQYQPIEPLNLFGSTDESRANGYVSNLLPTAAEFVPRFNNLSLTESNSIFNETGENEFTSFQEENEQKKSNDTNNSQVQSSNSNDDLRRIVGNQQNQSESGGENNSSPQNRRNLTSNTGAINKRIERNRDYGQSSRYYPNSSYTSRNRQRSENNRNFRRKENWKNNRDFSEIKNYEDKRNFTEDEDHIEANYMKPITGGAKGNNDSLGMGRENILFNLGGTNKTELNEKLSQREKLIQEIDNRRLECLVCVEQIKAHQSVWSCTNCFHIFHLNCIIKWGSSSKSDEGWRCPACQNITKTIPRDYYCFCGKMKNPVLNRNDTAHSCGETCGRKENCPHSCTLLCHPGPCPSCQAMVTRECGCGKKTKVSQCYLREDFECEEVCGKKLNCGIHDCDKSCHQGKCSNCEKKVDQICHCERVKRQVACTKESNEKKNFSCGKPCNKDLSCGNHKCKDVCHMGECKPCKLTPQMINCCPCGKMRISPEQRKSCLDPIPVCTGTCGRTLKCGPPSAPHHCVSKCHTGNCPPCNKQTAVKCRCGHMDKMIKCRQLTTKADDARCTKRCTKKRTCLKHKCNQECCIDIDHICPLQCNHTLSCGKHKCDLSCHFGSCPPCYRSSFDELYCECGANVIYPPVPCGTKRPPCDKPCSRRHPCDHPVQHNCHSAPNCPPCMIFTTKWCYGGHEQRKTIPCSQPNFSCGLPCTKDLKCGQHKCIKPCHDGPCENAGDICKQSCTKPRIMCTHKCNAPCHEGDCPDTPCKEMIEVSCECGNRKQMRTCQEISSEYRRIATAQLASSMQEMQRGNSIELSDIMGPIKMTNNKTLECTEECKIVQRNRRLDLALQIRNPDCQQPSKILTRYSDFIRSWAKKDPQLVKMIHDNLTNLVKLAKESKQKSRSHSFPTMNREKRQLVHEMCGIFGVDSVAYDAEPNRNVVATAHKERSWLPAMSIMEVVQRESGQRRVPVPNNNAWGVKK